MNRRLPGRRESIGLITPGPFNPIQLGPKAWYRGGVDISRVFSAIIYWGDQSGNGYHLEQNVVAWRPTLNYVDGKECVQGGGLAFMDNTAFSIGAQPITVAAVYNTNSSLGFLQTMTCGGADTECAQGYYYSGLDGFLYEFAAGLDVYGGPFDPSAVPRVGFVEFNTGASAMYDGVTLLTTGTVGASGMSKLTVGNLFSQTAPFAGTMMEIIIFDKVLTGPDRQNLYDYFATQWTVA